MKFLVDVMLGKLGRWMRMMGYDTEIASDKLKDHELVDKAEEEDRIIITRDKDIDEMNTEARVIFLKSKGFENQIKAVFNELGLEPRFPGGSRCSKCNAELRETGENTWVCRSCNQRYWKGSHWERIKEVQGFLRD